VSLDAPLTRRDGLGLAQTRASGRRWFRPKWILALLLAAVLLAIPAVDLAYDRAHPLERGSIGIDLRVCADPLDDSSCTFRAPRPGDRLWFGVSVRNRGSLPVTITDIEGPGLVYFKVDEVRTHPALGTPAFSEADPFMPFQLQAGEDRTLYIAAQFLPCVRLDDPSDARSYTTITDWPVTHRLLATPHTFQVKLHQHIRLQGNTNQCLPPESQPPSP
jgi:hypothetical protein